MQRSIWLGLFREHHRERNFSLVLSFCLKRKNKVIKIIERRYENNAKYPIKCYICFHMSSGKDKLAEFNRKLDEQVKSDLKKKISDSKKKSLPSLSDYSFIKLENDIEEIAKKLNLNPQTIKISQPPAKLKGVEDVDLAFNVGSVAREAGKEPEEVAKDLADEISKLDAVSDAEVIPLKGGAFVNIKLNHSGYSAGVLNEVQKLSDDYGSFNEGDSKVVVLDYSAPNIAKDMTAGHLRSTIIGYSLYKIYEAGGYVSFGINHLGDTGTTFGKVIYQYNKEMNERGDEFKKELETDPSGTLMRIYRKFGEESAKDPQAMDEARELSLRLEQGDEELMELWFKIREWSMECFYKVYDRIRVPFDGMMGESFYEDKMESEVEAGLKKEVFKKNEEGAVVFPGQTLTDPVTGKENPNVMKTRVNEDDKAEDMVWKDEIIIKPSGGTLYLTRDIATIKFRSKDLGAEKLLYVVGKEQKPHMMMLYNIADQLGICKIGKALHVAFGHLNMGGKKMKTREGKVILLNDILDETVEAAEELIKKRKEEVGEKSDLTDEEKEVANKVGIGTVVFNDLRQDREKDIEFNPDAAASLEAGGCPYIQYTYCRLGSILKKAEDYSDKYEVPSDISQVEKKILIVLSMFPNTVSEAMRSNSPHKIANTLDQLTQLVNTFYQSQDVNKASEPLKSFRIALVKACQQVIRNASDLLHVEMPERM